MAGVPEKSPRVHLLAGLNGAGKTTYARHLAAELPAVLFTPDEWMLRLYDLPYDDPGYGDLTRSCRELIWDVAVQVLANGLDVVLDWNCWSRAQRADWSSRAGAHGYRTTLHYLQVPVETAIARAAARAAAGARWAHALDAAAIRHGAGLFEEPGQSEGIELNLVPVRRRSALRQLPAERQV